MCKRWFLPGCFFFNNCTAHNYKKQAERPHRAEDGKPAHGNRLTGAPRARFIDLPDAIAMDQSDHADSRALPCQQESLSKSYPIHQRSLLDQHHCLDSSQERPWRIVGWQSLEASVHA